MNDKLYLISFKTEGVEQIQKPSNDGDDDRDDTGLDEDDLLGDDTFGGKDGTQTPKGNTCSSGDLNKRDKTQDQESSKSKTKSNSLVKNLARIFSVSRLPQRA